MLVLMDQFLDNPFGDLREECWLLALELLDSIGGGPGVPMHCIIDQGSKERMVPIGAFTLGLYCTTLLAIPCQLPIFAGPQYLCHSRLVESPDSLSLRTCTGYKTDHQVTALLDIYT